MASDTRFQIGAPGRPKGAIGKRSQHFLEVLEKHNFCAATAMVECYREARKTYDNYGLIYDAICDAREAKEGFVAPTEDNAHKYLKIAADLAKELGSYSYPKLKAVEQTHETPTEGMTPEQKLEAMKQAVLMLELQLKQKNG